MYISTQPLTVRDVSSIREIYTRIVHVQLVNLLVILC